MHGIRILAVAFACGALVMDRAIGDPGASAIPSVTLRVAPSLDPAWVQSLAGYVQAVALVPVAVATDPEWEVALTQAAVDHYTALQAATNASGIQVVVVNVRDGAAGMAPLLSGATNVVRVGVVNAAAWEPRGTNRPTLVDVWRPRLEKDVAWTAVTQLGMPECKFALCLLFAHSSVDELDMKARDLCPPCQYRLRTLLGLPE